MVRKTEAFIDIFDPAELVAYMTSSGDGPLLDCTNVRDEPGGGIPSPKYIGRMRRVSLDLILAIGAQCTSKQDSQSTVRALFHKAQRQAFSEMIQDPDLDMVRIYLLMAFFMLGECRRNTAYMYLSVATRAAIALGLHSPSSYSRQQPLNAVDKVKIRVWMTCRVGDKLVNSLLGRPADTLGIPEQLGPVYTDLISGEDYGLRCMVASYRIVYIIDEINSKLYSEQDVRPAVIEQLLQAIEIWKVILTTRPVFISALGQENEDTPMGEACLDAAVFLAQACVEALDSGLLESNMCIMKALIFAAGLVLGVRNFARPDVNFETESAFEGAKRVLTFLAIRSAQASHYLDILNSLSNAITEKRSRRNQSRDNRYVSRLFSPGSLKAGPEVFGERMHGDVSEPDEVQINFASTDIDNLPSLGHSPLRCPINSQIDPELFIDWETVNISHWDNFPFSA
ncbi:hypothetical protein D6C89_10113 [Aureobasidium pullulans]|nr:hypothetical protein D6C89_10113 [Aureobasidium pullulans]